MKLHVITSDNDDAFEKEVTEYVNGIEKGLYVKNITYTTTPLLNGENIMHTAYIEMTEIGKEQNK